METLIALDTHVVAWLHAGETERFPAGVYRRLDAGELVVCPVVLLELEYLHEIGRLSVNADRIFADLAVEIGLGLCPYPFAGVIRESLKQAWTRDPFDRLIAAHALAAGHDLATKDENILAHCPSAFWG
ncbi:MAG: PIN domain-containing protein [Terrimicrobiaceae bacterium]